MPKLALRTLGLEQSDVAPTVTGGLTFFGAPLNNYMGHATSAMGRRAARASGGPGPALRPGRLRQQAPRPDRRNRGGGA
ncbi:hypothetical protein ACRAWD_10300 [Caulobacter segnis]